MVCAGTVVAAASASAANIAWVSFHSGDNTPATGSANAGFTQAPDIGYTDLLKANGHTVTRFVSADSFAVSQVAGFDLVIIGRSVASGHYQQANETLAWNSFTGKLLNMGDYTLRGSRLGWLASGTTGSATDFMVDTVGNVALKPTGPHPIFQGIPVDGFTGNMFNPFATAVTYTAFGTNVTARGISLSTNAPVGDAEVLATISMTIGGTLYDIPAIALWDAGATVNDGTEVLGGWRMAFMSGGREANGIDSTTAGVYDLTPDGAKLFLNSIDYFINVVPEPSTFALFAFGGLALLLRRKQV